MGGLKGCIEKGSWEGVLIGWVKQWCSSVVEPGNTSLPVIRGVCIEWVG